MKEKDDSNLINDEILTFSKGPANDKLLDNSHLDLIDIKKPSFCSNCFNAIFPCFKKVDTKTRRLVLFRNSENNVTYWSNKEENHKYNALLFFPIVLFNQFRQFGNFFYLILSISQFIPQFQVGFLFTYISPLCMVVFFSMGKELYDDIKRRIQDKKTNSTLITTLQMNPRDWQVKKVQK